MNLKIALAAVCRTPLFPYNTNLKEVWADLKEAIKLSSSDFYLLIKDISADKIDQLDPKIKFACWKYFNRARYRATPFGSFGSITLLPIAEGNEAVIAHKPDISHFIDWSYKDLLIEHLEELYQKASYLLANSTAYPAGRQLRYISVNQAHIFELSSIEKQHIIEDILSIYKTPDVKDTALHLLASRYKLQPKIAEDLLKQLIELQLLITDRHPNMIGTDYFKRIHFAPETSSLPYSISERKWISGSLNKRELSILPEAIQFLNNHLPEVVHAPLSAFKTQFKTKFEYKEVPLLLALDPELGIGYDDLEVSSASNELIDTLKNSASSQPKQQEIPYSFFHQALLNEILKKKDTIQLEELEKSENNLIQHKTLHIPNTLNAIIQLTDKQLVLEQAGGVTATALLGRFTLEHPAMTGYCRDLVAIEQEANPDIIFFDIAYQAEKRIDNVNRRASIYPQELSLLSWPSDNQQLLLSDIMVSIKGDEIILRSKTHQKRLVPRLASAYNYKRSDLSVYRFLCDLQQQHLQTNFYINPRHLFPNLIYYPRISYKHLLISPRIWKVPSQFQQGLKPSLATLKEWLLTNQVSSSFKCGRHDQFLLFDSTREDDLLFFLQHIKGEEDHYITEVFAPRKTALKDPSGQPYAGQYIIQLYHKERIYQPASTENHEWNRQGKSLILPGHNWLYVEIYTHPSHSNFLLTERIRSYLKKADKHIKSWFFIRYTIPSPHIRLRVQLKKADSFHFALSLLTSILEEDIREGMVSDLQIKPYQRETERYGLHEIEAVENHFWLESKYSIQLIQQHCDDKYRYALVIRFLNDLFHSIAINHASQLTFVQRIAKSFAKEMNISTKGFKKINESFTTFEKQQAIQLPKNTEHAYQKMRAHVSALLNSVNSSKRLQLLRDFIHMHVNRLFVTDQRMHELLIYQYYQKLLMAGQKRSVPPI